MLTRDFEQVGHALLRVLRLVVDLLPDEVVRVLRELDDLAYVLYGTRVDALVVVDERLELGVEELGALLGLLGLAAFAHLRPVLELVERTERTALARLAALQALYGRAQVGLEVGERVGELDVEGVRALGLESLLMLDDGRVHVVYEME